MVDSLNSILHQFYSIHIRFPLKFCHIKKFNQKFFFDFGFYWKKTSKKNNKRNKVISFGFLVIFLNLFTGNLFKNLNSIFLFLNQLKVTFVSC